VDHDAIHHIDQNTLDAGAKGKRHFTQRFLARHGIANIGQVSHHGRYFMPDGVRLRVAVQQQKRRTASGSHGMHAHSRFHFDLQARHPGTSCSATLMTLKHRMNAL
jgi:hypothetical protein